MISDRTELGGRNIVPGELALYDADRLFVLVANSSAAKDRYQQLVSSPEWRRLHAVRGGNVKLLDGRWFPYDAHTLDWELDEVVKIL